MRIEQPPHLNPYYRESFRRNTRFGVRAIVILGLFPSGLFLGLLARIASDGQPVAAWRWVAGVGMGPLMIAVCKLGIRVCGPGRRFAEIRGNRVHLGPVGHSIRPSLVESCEIEPDIQFPAVGHLCLRYRFNRFTRPRFWTMMVDDLAEAEEFRRNIVVLAARARPSRRGRPRDSS